MSSTRLIVHFLGVRVALRKAVGYAVPITTWEQRHDRTKEGCDDTLASG
jgi:hypothetical protein